MLLIAAFAIFVIITKRLRITRTITITGENARRFGITLLVATIPISMITGQLINAIMKFAPLRWPIPQAIHGGLFGAAVFAIAWHFRNDPGDRVVQGKTTSSPAGHVEGEITPGDSARSDQSA